MYMKTYSRINWENFSSISTPINAANLNKMDSAIDSIEDELVILDATKADQSAVLGCCNSVTYNTTTGVFTFGFVDGTSKTVDLNVEKIPVSFSMIADGVITMTTSDGTTFTADVGALIKAYTFNNSDQIQFDTTTDDNGNVTVTATVIDGSITENKLQPNFLADCRTAKQSAESASSDAQTYAGNSAQSSYDSEAYAIGTRNGVPVSDDDVAYHNNAKYYAESGGGGASTWSELSGKPFETVGNGLSVSGNALNADIKSIEEVFETGSSATTMYKHYIKINDNTQIVLERYMFKKATLSTTATTTVTFTNTEISDNDQVDVYCDYDYVAPDGITISNGSLALSIPPQPYSIAPTFKVVFKRGV